MYVIPFISTYIFLYAFAISHREKRNDDVEMKI